MDKTEGTERWGEEENVDLHFPNIFGMYVPQSTAQPF